VESKEPRLFIFPDMRYDLPFSNLSNCPSGIAITTVDPGFGKSVAPLNICSTITFANFLGLVGPPGDNFVTSVFEMVP